VSDTVLAKPVQALTVVVLQNGLPKPGVVVSFEGLPAQGTDPNGPGSTSGGILVSSVAANDFVGFVSDTTDLSGRASVLVQFGTRAGAKLYTRPARPSEPAWTPSTYTRPCTRPPPS